MLPSDVRRDGCALLDIGVLLGRATVAMACRIVRRKTTQDFALLAVARGRTDLKRRTSSDSRERGSRNATESRMMTEKLSENASHNVWVKLAQLD